MKHAKVYALLITFTSFLLSARMAGGQEPVDILSMFRPLIGRTWAGHFVGSSDSELKHVIRWEKILNGSVVKSTKTVAALDFQMETYFYWDWEKEHIAFLQLTSRGIFSRGTAGFINGKIELSGTGIKPNGVSEFKQTFEIKSDGSLKDYYYRKENGEWLQGHLIEYYGQTERAE